VHPQPSVSLRLVRIQIVEDDVDLRAGIPGNNVIHEIQELSERKATCACRMAER
jgi:hypothetical protein